MNKETSFSHKGKRVYVAGASGLAGSAIVRRLEKLDCDIITVPSAELDLRRQADTESWFEKTRPDAVYLCAATAGGIHDNYARPGSFIYDNLAIQNSIIHASYLYDVEKLCFLGSSCIYPRDAAQPMTEEALMTGTLDKHNVWYAVAKIAGLYMCDGYSKQYQKDFISVMPANLYGPGDKYTEENSHVVAALLDRFHRAKAAGQPSVTIWGTGKARREFLYCDDMARACTFLMENYSSSEILNVGNEKDYSITELAQMIAQCVGYDGRMEYDLTKPDGMPRKIVDISKIKALGWAPEVSFEDGIETTYRWYLENVQPVRD